jgi:hypothetical protein
MRFDIELSDLGGLLGWRWTRPMCLRNGIGPCRARWLEHKPCLRKLAVYDAVGLHACSTLRLAGLWISPFEGEAESRAVTRKRVIVHDDTYAGTLFMALQ